jgi:ribosome recycling factor
MFNFKNLQNNINETESWLSGELSSIRTGRAAISFLDPILVEAYGSKMPLKELSSVSIEGPKAIRIEPWDKGLIKPIEKSLQSASLGVSVNVDDRGLRVIFPDLTTERRQELSKLAGAKLEEARVRLRSHRDKTWNEIQAKEKEGGMGEDDKFRLKEEMQKYIDEANNKLESLSDKKKDEIMS